MKTIFNQEDNNELVERISNLKEDSERKWGKMNVSQMLVHCQKPLEVAAEQLFIKRNIFSYLFGAMMKKKLIDNGEDFKQNLPTSKQFKIESDFDFKKEQEMLNKMVQSLGQKGESAIKIKIHPFFGKMTSNEWGILFYKHLDHHLQQFGV
jgi:hypothetical protein